MPEMFSFNGSFLLPENLSVLWENVRSTCTCYSIWARKQIHVISWDWMGFDEKMSSFTFNCLSLVP